MSASAALDALRVAVLDGDGRRAARYADAAARAGASQGMVKAVIEEAKRDGESEAPPLHAIRSDPMRWLADVLDLSLLEEGLTGTAPLSRPAQRVIGVGFRGGLAEAIARVTGLSPDEPAISDTVERARLSGESTEVLPDASGTGSGHRLVVARAPNGNLRALVARAGTAQSVALQRRAEEAEILAGANHEMANAVTAMAAIAAQALARGAAHHEPALERIERTASEMLESVQSARRALRHSSPEMSAPHDVGPLLRDLAQSLMPLAQRSGVEVEVHVEERLMATVSRTDLRSIVWNLIKNAIEAVPRGGRVWVRASAGAAHVELSVEDDGPGMDEETARQAFESHFTTKETGMGLGLSMVRDTVKRLAGEVALETSPGAGTRFRISLPRRSTVVPGQSWASGVRHRNPLLGVRVLGLSEKDDFVPADALRLQGMEYVQLAALHEALGEREPFDAVLVDESFDGGRGAEAAAELLRTGVARYRVVIGTSDGVSLVRGFTIAELLSAIAAGLLDEESALGG